MNETTVKAGGSEMYQDEDGYYHSYPNQSPQVPQSSPNGVDVHGGATAQGASEHYGQQPAVNQNRYYNQQPYNQSGTPAAWPTQQDSQPYATPRQNPWQPQQPPFTPPQQQNSWQQGYMPPPQNGWQPPYPGPNQATSRPAAPVLTRSGRSGWRTGAIALLTLVVIAVFCVGLFAGWQFIGSNHTANTASTNGQSTGSSSNTTTGNGAGNATIQTQQENAIAKIEPSVVELDVTVAQGEQIGSGVIIDNKGDIVTNNHVVNGAQSIKVILNNGNSETGQLVGTVANNDLAIVRIQPFNNMKVATIGDSSKLTVGQQVMAVGNPLGITETATNGIVSALNRSVTESDGNSGGPTISNAIQTDAPINPGNSGGALIDLNGDLVGIPTLTAVNTESNTPANGVGFAIPSSTVKDAINQILHQ
jgi:S1-C subfamily serine protease